MVGLFCFLGCTKEDEMEEVNTRTSTTYKLEGVTLDQIGRPIVGVKITIGAITILSDSVGEWQFESLPAENTLIVESDQYTFNPNRRSYFGSNVGIRLLGNRKLDSVEKKIYRWIEQQQLSNGLVTSAESGNLVSLYDNALAALVFMLHGDVQRAERIFNFFNFRINSELKDGVGGFSQFRNPQGVPNGHRWMGDNAWLLIALNQYKSLTAHTTYDQLRTELSNWLKSLQDTDGGLFAGYRADNTLLNYKVTEGNIDAFNAIDGYSNFHSQLLNFLKVDRWNSSASSLVAWPGNPQHLFALDLHPWAYMIFENYPEATLTDAQRYLNTQTSTQGPQITGYCFDEDKDVVWLEGTAQMATAFSLAERHQEKGQYLAEMRKILLNSKNDSTLAGFAYGSNVGSVYGSDLLWQGGDTEIALSGGAWYLFAIHNFNPFATHRKKPIPNLDLFW